MSDKNWTPLDADAWSRAESIARRLLNIEERIGIGHASYARAVLALDEQIRTRPALSADEVGAIKGALVRLRAEKFAASAMNVSTECYDKDIALLDRLTKERT
jgi:hypothetical protein